MPKPRKALINLAETPYYHCISRCVRRAYLCGKDALTGHCYEHRRQWVEDRILLLAQYFAIDICSFAVMSNHIHLVLCVEGALCQSWSDKEVLYRWHKIYKGKERSLTHRYLNGESLSEYESSQVSDYVALYRSRLQDISWFMSALNEPIARKANAEDDCTGRFWEGRFKSQALLDEAALLSCMAYVDLNPVRAGVAKNLKESDHTSIQLRIRAAMQGKQPESLKPFQGHLKDSEAPQGLMFHLKDYLELVDATGRIIRHDKKGSIPESEAKLLNQFNISTKKWVHLIQKFETIFKTAVGQAESLTSFYQAQNYKKRVGISASKTYLEAS